MLPQTSPSQGRRHLRLVSLPHCSCAERSNEIATDANSQGDYYYELLRNLLVLCTEETVS